MKKNMRKIYCCILVCLLIFVLAGCGQMAAKSIGGDITMDLEPGEKLEEITWKDDSLWYLTRPMREDEVPETHVFQQSSQFGIFEGSVTVIEHSIGDKYE